MRRYKKEGSIVSAGFPGGITAYDRMYDEGTRETVDTTVVRKNKKPNFQADRIVKWALNKWGSPNEEIPIIVTKTMTTQIEDELGFRPDPKTIRKGLVMAKQAKEQEIENKGILP